MRMFAKFMLHSSCYPSPMLFICITLLCLIKLSKEDIVILEGSAKLEEFSFEEWEFSPAISFTGIEGVIVYSNPPDACSPISIPPVNFSVSHWFVLINGDSCGYDTKTLHSQLAGYSVAILSRHAGNNLDPFQHSKDYVSDIPAVIISETSATIIQEQFLYSISTSFRALIIPYPSSVMEMFLLVIVITGGLFTALSFLVWAFRYIKNKCKATTLHQRLLRHLKISLFQEGDSYETCAICLEDFKIRQKLRILPCLHGFHAKCIDPWLTSYQRTCPVCKMEIIFNEGRFEYIANETTPLLRN